MQLGCEAKPTVLMCCIVNLQADMCYQIAFKFLIATEIT